MWKRIALPAVVLALTAALAALSVTVSVPGAAAQGHELPGMCNGRSDPNVVLNAKATGSGPAAPKYILNLETDALGAPTGAMVLGRGAGRLMVTDWCRLWQHRPGQPSGHGCGDPGEEGAINAHAVGIGMLRGTGEVLVRTDVRATEEGKLFRVRYRALGGGHDETEEGCEDESWTRVPAHGWLPLDRLKVRAVE